MFRVEDNMLSFKSGLSGIESWRIHNDVVNTIFVAVLSTIISYQVTAVVFDLFLGMKRRGEATASNVQILLLTDESSPLSIAAAIFRLDILDRLRFRPKLPKSVSIARNNRSIPSSVLWKLAFLLLTAPVINLLSVVLALERDRRISFESISFKGVAMGLALGDSAVSTSPFTPQCTRFNTKIHKDTFNQAEFFLCRETPVLRYEEPHQTPNVSVASLPKGQIQLSFKVTNDDSPRHYYFWYIDMSSGGEVYRLNNVFNVSDLTYLARQTKVKLEKFCESNPGNNTTRETARQFIPEVSKDSVIQPLDVEGCSTDNPNLFGVTKEIEQLFSLVESESFEIHKVSTIPSQQVDKLDWNDGKDKTLHIRRGLYLSPLPLTAFVLCVSILRVVVSIFTNNDIYDGIDRAIARRFGMQRSYDLVRSSSVMRYNHKYQYGKYAHFGMERPHLQEVDHFEESIVGLLEDSTVESDWSNTDSDK